MYRRNPRMPTEDMDEILKGNLLSWLYILLEDLSQAQENARQNISRAQRKQKEKHDRKVNPDRIFRIGDKVLMYDAARDKHFIGKLKPKWKGPYYVHDILRNGAYKLRTMDGKVLAAPINLYLLKKYYDCTTWEPLIVLRDDQ